jgi:hypothetical protein
MQSSTLVSCEYGTKRDDHDDRREKDEKLEVIGAVGLAEGGTPNRRKNPLVAEASLDLP